MLERTRRCVLLVGENKVTRTVVVQGAHSLRIEGASVPTYFVSGVGKRFGSPPVVCVIIASNEGYPPYGFECPGYLRLPSLVPTGTQSSTPTSFSPEVVDACNPCILLSPGRRSHGAAGAVGRADAREGHGREHAAARTAEAERPAVLGAACESAACAQFGRLRLLLAVPWRTASVACSSESDGDIRDWSVAVRERAAQTLVM